MNVKRFQDASQFSLAVAALGIVYGDIGTSPLYALRESIDGFGIKLPVILGVLSLIFWSLIAIISIKYLWLVFRADNDGEGGVLALLALLKRGNDKSLLPLLFIIGIFAAGLMFGDGMLTPAISIVSAVEGLHVVFPSLGSYVVPISCVILFGLFAVQHYGTAKIGFIFGPVILVWFVTIGILGAHNIIENPVVLQAINPRYAFEFFQQGGWHSYKMLGSIFLVVTGGEALYADMGHLGKKPIRFSWFFVVLPALMLNYFGQGAHLIAHPEAINNPFYLMSPHWFEVPLLIIATLATIIASQAVITATFSLTKQAVLLGLYPLLPIVQTSKTHYGQIYIPQMNFILGIGTLLLIWNFKTSSALAHAYGITINLVMVLTTTMIAALAYKRWHWPLVVVVSVFSVFLCIELAFLGANLEKIITGGWVPLTLACMCAAIMYTWDRGMNYLREHYYPKKGDISKILIDLHHAQLHPLPDSTAVFITDIYDKSGGSFLHFLKLSGAMPERVLILNYNVENIPYVKPIDRYEVKKLDENICELTLHFGFMDFISIPHHLFNANDRGLLPFNVDIETVTYLVDIPHVIAAKKHVSSLYHWQEKLFAFLLRNYSANLNIEFYHLPFNRTVAIGSYFLL